jgi:FkbM family methyltransferase
VLRQRVIGVAARNWRRVSPLLPERYLPFPVRGGWAYLSLANSPTQLQRVLRVYEPDKYANIARFLPPGGGFVDVGGNAGDFSVWAAHVGGPEARVLAIEAEPRNAEWLRRTVRRNGLDGRVSVVHAAATDSTGTVELLVTAKNGTHSIVESELHVAHDAFRPVRRESVPARRLDDLVAESPLTRVDVVKIDVEGAEMHVLRGATALLDRGDPMTFLIDLHFGVDVAELGALLLRHGFSLRREDAPDVEIPSISAGTLSIVAVR